MVFKNQDMGQALLIATKAFFLGSGRKQIWGRKLDRYNFPSRALCYLPPSAVRALNSNISICIPFPNHTKVSLHTHTNKTDSHKISELLSSWSSLVAQWVKDLVLLSVQCGFSPGPGNFHMPRVQQKKKKKKKEEEELL